MFKTKFTTTYSFAKLNRSAPKIIRESVDDLGNNKYKIITVFSSRVYGLRSYKEKIIVEKQNILNKISNLTFIHFIINCYFSLFIYF